MIAAGGGGEVGENGKPSLLSRWICRDPVSGGKSSCPGAWQEVPKRDRLRMRTETEGFGRARLDKEVTDTGRGRRWLK